ncbi:unnamed protein product, partial [Polarella glacialis]
QAMAKHSAELYNAEVARRAAESSIGREGAHYIDFLLTHIIQLSDGSTYGAEAFVFGSYEKYNNNSGGTMGDRRTPQTFSYFSWVSSGRCRMIVDIQGVDDLYTDPVVHFLPSHESGSFKTADSPVNLGIRGFALFLWSHRYNEIDRLLQLPIFVLSRSEQEARPPEACTIQDLHQGLGLQTSTRDTATRKAETVSLASVRDIDLRATSFASE